MQRATFNVLGCPCGVSMAWSDFKVDTATVRCEPSGREVTVMHETTLLDAILQAHLPLGQSCDGVALCGFCRVTVVDGIDNLSPKFGEEDRILQSLHADSDERLACCAKVHGPVTITTGYW